MEEFAQWLSPDGDGNDLPEAPGCGIDVAVELAKILSVKHKAIDVKNVKNDVQ